MKRLPGSLPLYVENEAHQNQMTSLFLDDAAYSDATQCLVLLCVDALVINRKERALYVARRKSRPAKDWQWFIGGRRKFGEHALQGMVRTFQRETKLWVPPRMFRYVDLNEYFFVDRQQVPQNIGTHSVALTYSVNLSERQIAMIRLDPHEYHDGGLQKLRFKDLRESDLPQPVKDIARKVFTQKRKARS